MVGPSARVKGLCGCPRATVNLFSSFIFFNLKEFAGFSLVFTLQYVFLMLDSMHWTNRRSLNFES